MFLCFSGWISGWLPKDWKCLRYAWRVLPKICSLLTQVAFWNSLVYGSWKVHSLGEFWRVVRCMLYLKSKLSRSLWIVLNRPLCSNIVNWNVKSLLPQTPLYKSFFIVRKIIFTEMQGGIGGQWCSFWSLGNPSYSDWLTAVISPQSNCTLKVSDLD